METHFAQGEKKRNQGWLSARTRIKLRELGIWFAALLFGLALSAGIAVLL